MSENNQSGEIKGVVTLNADPAVQGFQKVEDAGKRAADSLKKSSREAAEGLSGIGAGADEGAKKVDASTKSLISSIQRATAAAEAGGRSTAAYYKAIADQKGVSGDALKPYLDQLRSAEALQRQATQAAVLGNQALGSMGTSAKATAAALRGVPAQFTDIITSVQGGQAPLTVLLQQGGQLKDMFGGAGNAAKALGGYVLGLVNPYTLLAAAALGTVAAYEKGAGAQRKFQETLILTGGVAGVTANQLSEAAAGLGRFGNGTVGKAAESLDVFVNAGVRGREELQRFTGSAIEFERVGGTAVDKVAENFAKLGKDPLKASLALNESTGFLTRSLYEQIKGLEDQGRATDAAKVAQEAYDAAIKDRTPQLLANLGFIERAWLGIKDATKAAADAALNVGRPQTFTEQGDELRQRITGREARLAGAGFTSNEGGAAFGRGLSGASLAKEQAALEADRQALSALNERVRLEQKVAGIKADEAVKLGALQTADKLREQHLNKVLKMEREIEQARNVFKTAGLSDKDVAPVIAGIEKKYEDKSGLADTKRGVDAQIEALRRGAAVKAEIAKQEADTRASEFKRGITNELQYIDLEKDAKLKALAESKAILERERDLLAGKAGRQKELAELAGQIALNEQQAAGLVVAANNKVLDVKAKQVTASEAVYQAQRDEDAAAITASILANAAARAAGEKGVRDYAKSIDEANAFTAFEIALMGQSDQARATSIEQYKIQIELKKQLKAIDENPGFSPEDRATARAAAEAAAASAAAGASSKAYLDEWKRTTASIEQSLTDALMRGFESGKGFGDNLKDTFKNLSKTLVLKPVIDVATKPAAQAISKLTSEFAGFVTAKLAGDQAMAASTQATVGTEVAASQIKGQAKATEAVAGAATGGDPWTAFFRAAAMIALMAGIGYVVKGGGGGGGAPVTNQGTGTVFGDPTAKSASIENSIDLLADTSLTGLRYSASMAASLKNIESAMTGVTSLLLRGGDLSGVGAAVQTGYFDSAMSAQHGKFYEAIRGIDLFQGALAKVSTKLFGKKISIQGTGIVGDKQSFGDIDDLGFRGSYYADVQSQSKFFGVTTSTKNSTVLSALDEQMGRQFSLIFRGIGDTVEAAAGGLGLNLDVIDQRLKEFVVDIGKIDLKGLNGTEIQEKLSAVFGAEADKIAGYVIPGFEAIQKVGEGYFETLVRASHQLEVADLSLSRMGLTLGRVGEGAKTADEVMAAILNGTPAPGVKRAIDADALVQQFGDLDTFTTATEDFYRAFFSQADQTRNTFDLLGMSLKGIGIEMPTNIKAFRDLTTGLDLTTDGGRRAFEVLTTIGPAFAQLQDDILSAAGIGVDEIASTIRDGLLGRITQEDLGAKLSGIVIDGFYNSLANGVADQIAQAFTNQIIAPMLQSIVAGGTLSSALSKDNLDGFIADAQAQIKAFTGVLSSPEIQSALGQLRAGLTGVTSAMNGLTAAAASTAAAAGGALPSTAGSYVQGGVTYRVGNAADLASEAIKGTTTALTGAADAWKGIGDTITGEIDRIRGVLRGAGPAGEAASLAQFTVLTGQARAGDQEAAKLLAKASQDYLTLAVSNAGSKLEQQLALGQIQESLLDTRKILAAQFGVSMPSFDVGTNYVPRDMTARIHQGEAIVPRAYNPAAGGAGGAVASQELLREVVERLKKLEGFAETTELNTRKAASLLSDVTNEGQAMLTEAA